ncbi:MAG TPA: hypothetical protein VGQ30_06460, partial [Gemmatimonadaceae bacterium]|nr:hypothetical protein [Gemmatimonadaceae bacterium]
MSSLRTAAALLAGAKSFRELAPFLPALGFAESLPLDLGDRRAIGLDRSIRRAAVANGSGTLRALLLEAATDAPARETITRVASRVTAHAPHLLWLLVMVQPASESLVIAAPASAGRKQVSALLTTIAGIAPSDAETLAAMCDAAAGADVLVHHRWRELLGREALTRRFYRELENVVDKLAISAAGRVAGTARRELALLCSSRILFLAFLEA